MNPFIPKPLGKGKFDMILEGKIIQKDYRVGIGLMKE